MITRRDHGVGRGRSLGFGQSEGSDRTAPRDCIEMGKIALRADDESYAARPGLIAG